MLVGDRERDRTVGVLRRAYAAGYLDERELERRLDRALRARTVVELGGSVRGVPGGISSVALEGFVRPAVERRTTRVRVAAARLMMKLALGAWWATTLLLAAVTVVWAAAATIPVAGGIALAIVWLGASASAFAVRRRAARVIRR